jgi:site-specific recombinase XerD
MPLYKNSRINEVENEVFRIIEKYGMYNLEIVLKNTLGMIRKPEDNEIQNPVLKENSPLIMTLWEAKEMFFKDPNYLSVSQKKQEIFQSELMVFLNYCGMPQKEREQKSSKVQLKDVIHPTFISQYLSLYKNVNEKSKTASFLRFFIKTVAADEFNKKELSYQKALNVKIRVDASPLAFTEEQVEELLTLVKNGQNGFRNYTFIQVILHTGLRVSELRNIQIKDINFKQNTLKFKSNKHGERVKLLLTNVALEYLKTFIEFTYSYQKNELTEQEYRELYVFSSNEGKGAVTGRNIESFVQRAIKEAKTIPESSKYNYSGDKKIKNRHFSVHSFRNTFAFNLLKDGVDINIISKLLGHNDIEFTEKYLNLL